MDNKKTKKEYRDWAINLRKTLDLKNVSAVIESKVIKLDQYKTAKTVMSYHAKEIEVSVNNLFKDKVKNWFLPSVKNISGAQQDEVIVAVPYFSDTTKLIKGKFGILEPEIVDDNFFDQSRKKIKIDLVFVPGLCFDKNGYRIGFGKGYYDKFLKLNQNSFKIGMCPRQCIIEKIPDELWDIKMDLVLTD